MLFAVAYMYTCTRDHTCSRYYSKSRLFRLRANIGCPTFLDYEQLQCYHVNVYIYSHARKKTYKHINFTLSCFIAHTNLSYRKIKIKKNSPREIRTYIVPAICYCPIPKPLHYSGRYCPIATHIRDYISNNLISFPGRVAQLVTCLATDVCLTAIPGVASSIPARSHTFVEIDHEIISTVILLPSADHSRRVVVRYKRKYVYELLVIRLFKPAKEKSMVR